MISNQAAFVQELGKEKYDKLIETMEILVEKEENKGVFVAQEGMIDQRDAALKDIELHRGFWIKAGIKGGKLSGGQKQRLAIARTIIRKPKVLMLDEATSALDEDSQKKVQSALDQAMKGRTTIIIAHRMSTIEKCDKIFALEYGKVSEEGNFNALKNQGGLFSKLAANKK